MGEVKARHLFMRGHGYTPGWGEGCAKVQGALERESGQDIAEWIKHGLEMCMQQAVCPVFGTIGTGK
ncbi:hypothetical protein GCM10007385_19050 [Tateyamaria omphalii]|nr:hypothetical protein GCM10007385_19050 [Tateyamaria omphalii]